MSTIQDLFQQAQLAEAAYANFAAFPNNDTCIAGQARTLLSRAWGATMFFTVMTATIPWTEVQATIT